MTRVFEARPAARAQCPVWFGLFGASGSGKTDSSLRVATGIQRVAGGEIVVIDTEGRRALHYAPKVPGAREPGTFLFRHIDMEAPFGSLDYLEAVEYAVSEGARVIVIDSMTHEHDGDGGFLDLHARECERLAKKWGTTEDKATWTAWQEPKWRRRKAIDRMIQLGVHFVFCFRAEEKTKPPPRGERDPIKMGEQPIGGWAWVSEMSACALLRPGANGVPTWFGAEAGEKKMIKSPRYLAAITERVGYIERNDAEPKGSLDVMTGELLALWAGGGSDAYRRLEIAIAGARDADDLSPAGREVKAIPQSKLCTPAEHHMLKVAIRQRLAAFTQAPRVEGSEESPDPDQDGR